MVHSKLALKPPLFNSKLVYVYCLAAFVPFLSLVPVVEAAGYY